MLVPEAGPDPAPLKDPALPNGFRLSEKLLSGGNPDGDAGFAALAKLGVKTIISVDGARPDVDTARKYGLTYIHLPVGYDGISHDRIVELAKAATTLPGPIYVHCHHGQHRGPAAAAVFELCTDPAWDAARAESWLRTAGTDPRYVGLVKLPRSLVRPTAEELARAPADFPAVAPVGDLAKRMVEVDTRWDNLKLVQAAGWAVPKDHPDVDPPHEAVQLLEHFREAARLESVRKRGPELVSRFDDAAGAAGALEAAVRAAPINPDRAAAAFARSAATCSACHEKFRDRPSN
jgi:protein tyrosine phosphatase (PTP) superfamily phosphohydrolase (DUF442 family)